MRILAVSAAAVLLTACAGTGASRPGGGASIAGDIVYPSETTPEMRICALRGAGLPAVCIDSPAGRHSYRLEHLPAGDYQVVARLSEGDMRVGGHVQPVQCIRAPCPAPLKTITVAADSVVTGIDLNEFDAARADFPAVP